MSDFPNDAVIAELISGYFDESLSDEELATLSQWIRCDEEHAQHFARAAMLHDRLRTEFVAEEISTAHDVIEPAQEQTGNLRKRFGSSAVVAAVIAATLLIAVALTLPPSGQKGDEIVDSTAQESFVRVAHIVDADWGEKSLNLGDRLGSETLKLRRGLVRLQFDNGVDVTLEGPSEFSIASVSRTKLLSGTLVANVPPGAEGFQVDTPSAEVIDLGTSFGVDVGADGASDVLVFDGEIEVMTTAVETPQRLLEGESIRLSADGEAEPSDFDLTAFEKLWPISSGIVGSSESFRFLPPWPKRIRFVQSDNDIFVAAEGNAVQLSAELALNISKPGKCASVDDLTPLELSAGKTVRSYLLHYMPASQLGARRAKRMTGSVTFERPIVGVILRHEELLASSRRFTGRTAGEAHQRRQVDLVEDGDRVTLSEDRHTLTVDLISRGRSSDLIRVIVDAERPNRAKRDDTIATQVNQ